MEEEMWSFFRAFSNPTRIAIIQHLRFGPMCVKDICSSLGLEQSRVSHNLKCLENCGFVEVKKNGRLRYYSIEEKHILPILKHIDNHLKTYQKRLRECSKL